MIGLFLYALVGVLLLALRDPLAKGLENLSAIWRRYRARSSVISLSNTLEVLFALDSPNAFLGSQSA